VPLNLRINNAAPINLARAEGRDVDVTIRPDVPPGEYNLVLHSPTQSLTRTVSSPAEHAGRQPSNRVKLTVLPNRSAP